MSAGALMSIEMEGLQCLNGNIELNALTSNREVRQMFILRKFFESMDSKDGSWCKCCAECSCRGTCGRT